MEYILGPADDIAPDSSKAYCIDTPDGVLELFVVHYQGKFYAFENRCPHTGINLNWQPDQFLNIDHDRIQCATHGALFRIDSGRCEWGPCVGQSLHPLNVLIKSPQGQELLVLQD
jgi:nitrite reductase/ring-hydroxylating ferredoxin subunit